MVTCGNCFVGNVNPKHTLADHPTGGACVRDCEAQCLGWVEHTPKVNLTEAQAKRVGILSHRAVALLITPGTFDLPDGYVLVDVKYGAARVVTFGVDADGYASS